MNLKSNFFYTLLCNVFYQIKVKYYFLKVKLYFKLNKKVPQVPVCFTDKELKELTKIKTEY
jgi:hypothetical protein